MNKILYFTLFIILISISLITLINPSLIINSVISSSTVFLKTIFPALFPFFILSDFLINYNVIYYVSAFFSKIFKCDKNLILVIILSMISGYPSNAKFISEMENENIIDEESANRLVGKTFFPSPMFTLGTVSVLYLGDYKRGLLILLSIYFTNLILLLKFRFRESKHYKRTHIKPFGTILSQSVKKSFSTLISIMGSIVLFSLLIDIMNNYVHLNDLIITPINMILEMSSASKKISTLYISTDLKTILTSLTLTFGGLCVHSQMLSILRSDINYKIILLDRLKACLINAFIIMVLLTLA